MKNALAYYNWLLIKGEGRGRRRLHLDQQRRNRQRNASPRDPRQ
jgi:hypothetical protein